jgi:LDH2 family malate/lactate/ureidoglycolate dehydrogenase
LLATLADCRNAGVDSIRAPGERGNKLAAERAQTGIPLPAPVRNALADLARPVNVAVPWSD